MAAKQSAEMRRARRLVESGKMTAYAAAKHCGISPQAIYLSAWYREFKNGKR